LVRALITLFDSNALIYYFEGEARFRQATIDVLKRINANDPATKVAVSRLCVMECRAKPMREGNKSLLAKYDEFFERANIVELSAAVVNLATEIRATTQLKTPDCLQAACALSLGSACFFVTADAEFSNVQGLKVLQIQIAGGD
jgi:predicted nucleic acid-binding protein